MYTADSENDAISKFVWEAIEISSLATKPSARYIIVGPDVGSVKTGT